MQITVTHPLPSLGRPSRPNKGRRRTQRSSTVSLVFRLALAGRKRQLHPLVPRPWGQMPISKHFRRPPPSRTGPLELFATSLPPPRALLSALIHPHPVLHSSPQINNPLRRYLPQLFHNQYFHPRPLRSLSENLLLRQSCPLRLYVSHHRPQHLHP